MKNIFIIILIVISLIAVSCNKIGKTPSDITVTIGEQNIKYISLNDANNSTFKQYAKTDIQHVKIGEKVILDIGKNLPDKVTVSDSILNSNMEYRYNDEGTFDVPVKTENGKYFFIIDKNIASNLNSQHIEGQTDNRGFKVTVDLNKNKYEYGFVIKTDSL